MSRAVRLILSIAAVILIALLAHRQAEASDGLLASGAAIGTLLLGAWFTGRLVALITLPKITGYLIFGLFAGPYGLQAITHEQLDYLRLINDFAISLIALTAGGEIHLALLRKSARTISAILVMQIVAVMTGVVAVAYLTLPHLVTGVDFGSNAQLLIIALLVASVCCLSSPAAVIAVLTETRAEGPVAGMTLAVTVCKDLVLIVIFAVVVSVATGVIDPESTRSLVSASTLKTIAVHLLGSLAMGAGVGFVLAVWLRRVRVQIPLLVVFTCFGIAVVSESLHLEPLLVALTAGMLVLNAREHDAEALFDTVEELSVPVYCIFFALAGAKINPEALALTWPMALVLVGTRTATIWGGTTAGARLTGLRSNWLPLGYLPQAGVSIALAYAVKETLSGLPDISDAVFTLLLAAITCNEIAGPALLKLALVRSGETQKDA
ncbi:MAG: cation:proton antiporter [Phycisphaerales bacterium]|nr:cation:proton antiporter [Phycisphaerales bacterium]